MSIAIYHSDGLLFDLDIFVLSVKNPNISGIPECLNFFRNRFERINRVRTKHLSLLDMNTYEQTRKILSSLDGNT